MNRSAMGAVMFCMTELTGEQNDLSTYIQSGGESS